MTKKKSLDTLEAYRAKQQEASDLAAAAAKEIRDAAKEYMDELKRLAFEYQKLTGKSLPETQTLFRSGAANDSAPARKTRRTRSGLSGDYEGMTLRDAIKASLEGNRSGLSPGEIAEEIGGQRPSINVALSNMVKQGELNRVGRGQYTLA